MIRVVCSVCQSKLNAKDELAGQSRKCPKCGNAVQIPYSSEMGVSLEDAAPGQEIHDLLVEQLPDIPAPKRLNRAHRYLICDPTKIFAVWENTRQGWQLRTRAGYISAYRNPDQLPAHGEFALVELCFQVTDHGMRLRGLASYKLAEHWALTELDQGDNRILNKVTGPGGLNREQKAAVRHFLGEEFMRDVLQEAQAILDYLASADFHTHTVGTVPSATAEES